jgi:hypothetical protein
MTLKPTDSSERIKALMRQTTANMTAQPPATALRPPPPVAVTPTANSLARPAAPPNTPKVSWDRITIRLTAGEIQKINDVVIATQQANRQSRVTATDVLRAALRRIKDEEALAASVINALHEHDGRLTKRRAV